MTRQPQQHVLDFFQQHYQSVPQHLIMAPGRVNLIGEHTDYNDGFVLPCALEFGTYVAISPRSDQQIEVYALDYDQQRVCFSLQDNIEHDSTYGWSNYVRGVVQVLLEEGYILQGASLVISGNMPQGAGLSSSASLEVAVALAFSTLCGLDIPPQKLALIGQRAENDFVGCQCGIMDQLASAMGSAQQATLVDCRSLEIQHISIPEDLSIIIVYSGVQRGLVDSEYNQRRLECEEAAALLGVTALRDADLTLLKSKKSQLSEQVFRRARHVITENQRTLKAGQALTTGDITTLSQLMADSHWSLHHDYEVTVAPLDLLVNLIKEVLGELGGARMTGGGFGGCVVALCPHHLVDQVRSHLDTHYEQQSGLTPNIFICSASSGARVIL